MELKILLTTSLRRSVPCSEMMMDFLISATEHAWGLLSRSDRFNYRRQEAVTHSAAVKESQRMSPNLSVYSFSWNLLLL